MKVKDLIKQLQEFPEDYDIIVASDSEGNSFSFLESIGSYIYREYGRDIEIKNPIDAEDGETANCIVIWP